MANADALRQIPLKTSPQPEVPKPPELVSLDAEMSTVQILYAIYNG